MSSTRNIHDNRLADAWATLKAHSDAGLPLDPDASRLAFADPEFLLRRETRGIRIQLELLKPDLEQHARGIENTIVVFGSARFRSEEEATALVTAAEAGGDETAIRRARALARNSHYYEKARAFGRMVAQYSAGKDPRDMLFICTGGGPGIMQAANRGAFEGDGVSVGLSIALPMEEAANPYVTPELSFKFHYFALRKMHFMMRAKALVAFPGGFGTLDELFEVITLVQTRKARQVPIVLFGSDYWKRLIDFDMLIDEGVVSPADLALFQYADEPQAAWDYIRRFYGL
ncbi:MULTISPECIES: TIGR00730 family Rossman fold protein [Ramlibacter]|uniref:Cytokinin riboside 5'-monophosphate phosphoribohydrolase n=1 Tax=Ramlibacter pinisoli TaxID=2682844 RepID=A0A6N8IR77_9BURK|nr:MULTISPECIES: TIGR00730 family Rossman fold protein [Ramlibacter]MBA2963396.1 TIGR00730 family Rossman fold protein [Ramlibacter sp. CGMCC 1.13660]MVQ28363.1 TIGR00730 family Rossman fold protein [Ramlibacter pinisoli]